MPTSEHKDDEVEVFYGIIAEILEEDGKGNTNTIIMGDWNSVCWRHYSRYAWFPVIPVAQII
jgi:hypothetical protein